MGHGKSKLLVEFVRYMYDNYKNFGAVIVKKKLEECIDFTLDVGKKDSQKRGISRKKEKAMYDKFDFIEDEYIVKVIRGINSKDCRNKLADEEEYDYRLCKNCNKTKICSAYNSKIKAKNHRVIVITHKRLFEFKEVVNSLLHFVDEEGELKPRRLIVIDEKIDLVEIETFTLSDFNKLHSLINKSKNSDFIAQFDSISKFLYSLKYPTNSEQDVLLQPKIYESEFKFNEAICDYINQKAKQKEMLEKLLTLEKILGTKNKTTSRIFRSNKQQITYFSYFSLKDYCKQFKKAIVLDATSMCDYDYYVPKDDVIFVKDIIKRKYRLKIFYCNTNMSKQAIFDDYENKLEQISNEIAFIIEKENKKTLIVAYQDIFKKNNFKKDLIEELEKQELSQNYEVIHMGEYTTGTNNFNDCECIIILGNLDKSKHYYQNKALALGLDISSWEKIKKVDFLTETIQQIGRSAIRQNKSVNVYLFNNKCDVTDYLEKELSLKAKDYEPKYLQKKKKTFDIIIELILENCREKNEKIEKKKIKEILNQYGKSDSAFNKAINDNKEKFEKFLAKHKIKQESRYFQKY